MSKNADGGLRLCPEEFVCADRLTNNAVGLAVYVPTTPHNRLRRSGLRKIHVRAPCGRSLECELVCVRDVCQRTRRCCPIRFWRLKQGGNRARIQGDGDRRQRIPS